MNAPSRAVPMLMLAVVITCGPLAAQEIRFNVVPYTIDNGLKVLALEDHTLPVVSYYTFFGVGSRNETPGRTGVSHLFEHMMFNGSKNYPAGEFDRRLESNGGVSNAFTSEDMTVYYESFPSDTLPLVIQMEADRMAGLQLTEEMLQSERDVVKEERRLRVDNDVQGDMMELLQATAYVAHPYQWPVIGWMADLDAITVDDCRAYYRAHYAPNNATIVMVGDFKPDQVITMINSAYGSIASQPAAPAVVRNEPTQRGERLALLRREAQLPAVAIAYHVPPVQVVDVMALDLIETILAGGDSARLVRALVHEQQLATRVEVFNSWRSDPSDFLIYAEAKPGVTAAVLEAAMQAEIARLVADGVGESELQKAKNVRTTSLVKSLKTSAGKAEQLGLFELLFGSHTKLFNILKTYQSLGKEPLQKVAAFYLTADNRTVVTLVPATATEAAQ